MPPLSRSTTQKTRFKRRRHRPHHLKNKKTLYFLIAGTCLLLIIGWLVKPLLYPKAATNWSETKAADIKQVHLPDDDKPHDSKMEWWYYNGFLATQQGLNYSFHVSLFLIKGLTNHWVIHTSLSDHQTQKHLIEQTQSSGTPQKESKNGFDFGMNNTFKISGNDGQDTVLVNYQEFGFDLKLSEETTPILHGDHGIVQMGHAGSSYYYSRPRMKLSGTLKLGQQKTKVQGLAWFDHQWGDFTPGQLSWDWFSFQMNDGSDIMLYRLRDLKSDNISGNGSVTRNGVTHILTDKDFILTPISYWLSQRTNTQYPTRWKIEIPKYDMILEAQSKIQNSEFDSRLTTYNHYWEGSVDVSGSHTGKGFMELNGYKPTNEKH